MVKGEVCLRMCKSARQTNICIVSGIWNATESTNLRVRCVWVFWPFTCALENRTFWCQTACSSYLMVNGRKHHGRSTFCASRDYSSQRYSNEGEVCIGRNTMENIRECVFCVGFRPFKCSFDDCAYSTAHYSHLVTHERKHTGMSVTWRAPYNKMIPVLLTSCDLVCDGVQWVHMKITTSALNNIECSWSSKLGVIL